MFQEKLAEFNGIKANYEAIIFKLQERRNELEAKQTQVNVAYDRVLLEDIEKGTKRTQAELSKILQMEDEYERQLIDNEKRTEVAKEAMIKRLKELLPGLRQARDLAVADAKDEIKTRETKARELKAQYILFANDLNKPYREAQEYNSQFKEAAHAVNVREFDRDSIYMPTLNIVGTYEGPHASLIPTANEIMEAYTLGRLPFFVQLYEMTGEILPEDDARKKLEQLRRESGKSE